LVFSGTAFAPEMFQFPISIKLRRHGVTKG
jgi:hypothetical protein